MKLDKLAQDKDAMKALRDFFTHEKFNDIRIAFIGHSPKGDDKNADSIAVAYGTLLGTRYVFNKIEELVTTPPVNKPPRGATGPDPDLA